MLPVLGTVVPPKGAERYAVDLGVASQLSNFLRDVGEDRRRGRLNLPPLRGAYRFGVDVAALRAGVVDAAFRQLKAYEIARTRERSTVGRRSGPAARPDLARLNLGRAASLRPGILDDVERAGYRVLGERVVMPRRTRATVALPRSACTILASQGAPRGHRRSRRPSHTQTESVSSTSAKPKSRSSTGAQASRGPRIAPSS